MILSRLRRTKGAHTFPFLDSGCKELPVDGGNSEDNKGSREKPEAVEARRKAVEEWE